MWTTEEVLALAFDRPTHFEPGAQFEYNNTNYYLLGLVAEKIEGQPLASIFQDRLFGPLGMKNTALPVSTSNTIPEPYAHGYLYGGTSYALVDAPYPDELRRRPGRERSSRTMTRGRTLRRILRPASSSTADDLATDARARRRQGSQC